MARNPARKIVFRDSRILTIVHGPLKGHASWKLFKNWWQHHTTPSECCYPSCSVFRDIHLVQIQWIIKFSVTYIVI